MRPIALAVLACLPGCSTVDDVRETTPSKLQVSATSYPLAYFAERIGGDGVGVVFPAPPDVDPAEWNPGAEVLAHYQQADLILANGAGYEKWTERVSLPTAALVDTSSGFDDRYITIEDAVVHSHGPEGEHSHGQTAFTTWLDPTLAIEQARAIRDALTRARPEGEPDFEAGFLALERDLMALDERIARAVSGNPETALVASHPVYQYFARRYGLSLPSVHFEPDAPPDEEAWHDLEHLLDEHEAKWMLWEGEPLPETATRLRELGLTSVVFDPCGNRPTEGDYLTVMQSNAAGLERVFLER
jgi:zinc transport system substrate-binding protein